MSVINNILESVSSVINLLLGTISLLLHISYYLGKIIVASVLYSFEFVQSYFQKIQFVSFILYRDFCVFLSELHEYVTIFYSFFHQFATDIFTFAFSSWNGSKRLFSISASFVAFVANCISENGMKILNILAAIPEAVKHFIIIVGSGIWLAFKLIPLTIVYIGSLFVYFIGRSFEEIASIFRFSVKFLYSAYCHIIVFVSEIPHEAYFGIALGFILLLACIKYHSYITYHGIHTFMCLHRYFVIAICCTWNKLKELFSLTVRIIWNRDIEVYLVNNVDENIEENVDANIDWNVEQSEETTRHRNLKKVESVYQRRNIKRTSPHGKGDEALCVVCLDAAKKVVIMPCRHLCICRNCCISVKREHGLCPVCRGAIRSAVEVYN